MKKVVIYLDKKLTENELLIYKDGEIHSVEIHELLPELKEVEQTVATQEDRISELEKTVANLAIIVKEK